jgi:hypothetical protein
MIPGSWPFRMSQMLHYFLQQILWCSTKSVRVLVRIFSSSKWITMLNVTLIIADIFTQALSSFDPTNWTTVCPTQPNFPYGEGVVTETDMYNSVKNTPNSIGYIEYSSWVTLQAPSSQLVNMINLAGELVSPDATSFLSASSDFDSSPELKYSSSSSLIANIVNGPGKDSWPFSAYYYVTLRTKDSQNCALSSELYTFLQWLLSSSLSHQVATEYGFTTLSGGVLQASNKMIGSMACCTKVGSTLLGKYFLQLWKTKKN